jgi:DNA-binding SARP family transcriptional activator
VQLASAWHADQPVEAREMVELLVASHGDRTRRALRETAETDEGALAKGAAGLLASVPMGSVTVEVRVLGPAAIAIHGRPVDGPEWRRGRVRALLCLIAHERRLRREDAMVRLWPELDEQAARHNLRVTLNYLQRLLEPDRRTGEAPFYLRQDGDWLRLLEEPHVVVDAERFEHAIDGADRRREEGQLEGAAAAYEAAFAHWRGAYLADVTSEEWAQPAQARLSHRAVTARSAWASICLALNRVDDALDVTYGALEIDPWSEPVHRLVVAAQLARGDRPAAKRALDDLQRVLDDLSLPASPETQALARRLRDAG